MPATAQGFPTSEGLAHDCGEDLEVVECGGCGLVQLTNTPVAYYRDVIRAAAYSPEMAEFRLQQFKAWAAQYGLTEKKVLEIGCGKGEYLSLLHVSGLIAYGIEHALDSVGVCQDNGLKVTQGYLGDDEENGYANSFFDGFVCLNFMEHWPEPRKALQALLPMLKESAIGLLEVPNFDMIVQKGLFSEFISDHLLYFTEATLRLFLQNNGFEVLECKPVWKDYILSAVVRKREPTDLSFFADFLSKIAASLQAYIELFSGKKIAIWGAGHQALAVISLADIAHKIAFVVDSAPFKQGKFTPASHLPIVAPEYLNSSQVDAVIVMAASYSDEVARLIRSKFPNIKNIAILRDHGLEVVAGK